MKETLHSDNLSDEEEEVLEGGVIQKKKKRGLGTKIKELFTGKKDVDYA